MSLIGLAGFSGVLLSTRYGSGWVNDSFQYLSAAHNLAGGYGLVIPGGGIPAASTIPLTHYPPLLPVVLAGLEQIGGSPLDNVRALNAALFLANIFLVGITIRQITRSAAFSLAGAFLASVSPVFITLHSWALSEPLYLFLSMACFLSLGAYLKQESSGRSRHRWLLFSAVLAGLSVLTRYVGGTLVGVAVLVILLQRRPGRDAKSCVSTWPGGLYLVLGLGPFVAWTARSLLSAQTFNDRSIGLTPITSKNLNALAETALSWFVPEAIAQNYTRPILAALFLAGLAGAAFWAWRWRAAGRAQALPATNPFPKSVDPLLLLYAIYAGLYPLAVLAAKIFFDSWIGMSSRIFSPVLLSLWILLISWAAMGWNRDARFCVSLNRPGRVVVAAIYIYLILVYSFTTVPMVRRYYTQGISAPTRMMRTSKLLTTVRQLHDQGTVYTNWLYWYYLWTGQPATLISQSLDMPSAVKESLSTSNRPVYLVIFLKAPVPAGIDQAVEAITANAPPWMSDTAVAIYRYPP